MNLYRGIVIRDTLLIISSGYEILSCLSAISRASVGLRSPITGSVSGISAADHGFLSPPQTLTHFRFNGVQYMRGTDSKIEAEAEAEGRIN